MYRLKSRLLALFGGSKKKGAIFFSHRAGYAIRDYGCHIVGPISWHAENNGRDDRINYSA